jgi:hypothetical protein
MSFHFRKDYSRHLSRAPVTNDSCAVRSAGVKLKQKPLSALAVSFLEMRRVMNAYLIRSGAMMFLIVLFSGVVTHAQEARQFHSNMKHDNKRPASVTAMKVDHKHFAGSCISGPVQGMCGSGRRKTLLFRETLTSRDSRQISHPNYLLVKTHLRYSPGPVPSNPSTR